MFYGYNGKILHVDLNTGKLDVEEPGEEFFRKYVGGSAIGTYFALKNTPANIDPFDPDGQFCDKGPSYRAAIFVSTPEERALAEQSKQKVSDMFPGQKVVTQILDATKFYPIKGAESYHQDFYKKSPVRYKFYRWNCGRDSRLKSIWGDKATH